MARVRDARHWGMPEQSPPLLLKEKGPGDEVGWHASGPARVRDARHRPEIVIINIL